MMKVIQETRRAHQIIHHSFHLIVTFSYFYLIIRQPTS